MNAGNQNPPGESCGDCRCFYRMRDRETGKPKVTGLCRAKPPDIDRNGHAIFPLVMDEYWCGAFAPRGIDAD